MLRVTAAIFVALFAACASSPPPTSGTSKSTPRPQVAPTPSPVKAQPLASQIADVMCRCKTPECIDDVIRKALDEKPDELAPHELKLTACGMKAQVFAAATMVSRAEALARERCACKGATCASQFDKRVGAHKKRLVEYKYFVDKLPARLGARLRQATGKLEGCVSGGSMLDSSDSGMRIRVFADRMCACPDAACAQTVIKQMMEWIKRHFKGGKNKPTKANIERWKRVQQRLNKCYIDRMKAGANKPTP